MNGHPRHPAAEELAEFHAGVTDGTRGDHLAAHIAECARCASLTERLDQVSALLASVPPPALPYDVEARITGALAAEARLNPAAPGPSLAGFDGTSAASGESHAVPAVASASTPPSDSPAPASPVVPAADSHSPVAAASSSPAAPGRAWRRRGVLAPLGTLMAAAACLVLAFLGYRLSGTGHASAPSAAGGNAASPRLGGNSQVSGAPSARRDNLSPAMTPGSTAPFVIWISSANFRKTTLQAQVSQQLSAGRGTGQSAGPGTLAPTGHGDLRAVPSKRLSGCVLHVTGGVRPTLVEEATYQSVPAYVIAVPDHVWVTAHGCSAASPRLLASAPLPARH